MAMHSIIGSRVVIVLLIAAPLAVGGEVQFNEVAAGAPLPHWQPSTLYIPSQEFFSLKSRWQPQAACRVQTPSCLYQEEHPLDAALQ